MCDGRSPSPIGEVFGGGTFGVQHTMLSTGPFLEA